MKNKYALYVSVSILIVFIAYIIYDIAAPDPKALLINKGVENSTPEDKWQISDSIFSDYGSLKAVAVSSTGEIFLGGESFVACYNISKNPLWHIKTPLPVTSLSLSGDTIFASTQETILLFDTGGKTIDEWGPYEGGSIITCVASNKSFVAIADAGNKLVFIVSKSSELKSIIGQKGSRFIIPSPYFDVALTPDNKLIVANTGERRVETRSFEGDIISFFGEPGTAPGAFCGCCNPSHFALLPDRFVTAEKGINRIKIINKKGEFVEFVSSKNNFNPPIPLDIAAFDGNKIYAANPANSKLYIFSKREI